MLSLQRACQAVRAVLKAAEGVRGGSPAFNAYHIYRTLAILEKGGPVGRPTLARELGLGESPVKTLLQRLEDLGLAIKTGRGHVLSDDGWRIIRSLRDVIIMGKAPRSPLGDSMFIASPLVRSPKNLVDVYNIRDYIVGEECRTTLIGGIESGVPHYPGAPIEAIENLRDWAPGIDEGVIVIVPEACIDKAFTGLVKLIRKEYCLR